MLLALDIGNTNITLGLYDNADLLFTARLLTLAGKTADEYAVELKNIFSIHNRHVADVTGAIIATVVPAVGKVFEDAIEMLCGIHALKVGPGVKTGLNILVDDPAQVGADLAAGAVGALAKYQMPCIMIDMGTATTIFALDKSGNFRGGTIAAGVKLTLASLTAKTAQLPQVSIEAPKSVIGKNTADCMRSGLVFGTAAMLDGIIERMETELGGTATVVATGGLAKEIIKHCKKSIVYNENLLLDGLRLIFEKNK